jgi:hypothetical protein
LKTLLTLKAGESSRFRPPAQPPDLLSHDARNKSVNIVGSQLATAVKFILIVVLDLDRHPSVLLKRAATPESRPNLGHMYGHKSPHAANLY